MLSPNKTKGEFMSKYSLPKTAVLGLLLAALLSVQAFSQSTRTFSGTIVTPQFELVPNVTI